jgi:phosphate-selective porin
MDQRFRSSSRTHTSYSTGIGPLNAINAFPVPDGDTGTNMHLTLRAAIDELASTGGGAVSTPRTRWRRRPDGHAATRA